MVPLPLDTSQASDEAPWASQREATLDLLANNSNHLEADKKKKKKKKKKKLEIKGSEMIMMRVKMREREREKKRLIHSWEVTAACSHVRVSYRA